MFWPTSYSSLRVSYFVSHLHKNLYRVKNGAEFIQSLNESIEQANASFSTVNIISNADFTESIVPLAGTYMDKYKIYDTINLYFTEKSNYIFSKWSITPEESVEFINCEPTDNNVTIKLLSSGNISIETECIPRDTLDITLSSEHAVVTPVEQKACVDETFTIDCREESDYYFVGWQVFDSNGEEIKDFSDLLEIKEPQNQKTQVTVKKAGEKISLIPNLLERPKIVSSSPTYDANGVTRGSKIVIMFNKEIDENCIYFTESELTDFADKNYTLLVDIPRGGKCYGYINNGNIVYKNIQICNYQDNSINYLKYFGAPYFDPNYPKILRISTNQDLLPPTAIDILVVLSKDIYYTDATTNISIPLNGDYSFNYKTNSGVDDYNPLMGAYDETEDDFVVRVVPENNAEKYYKGWESLLSPDPYKNETIIKPKSTDIAKLNAKNKKLWIRGLISDGDSGPATLNWSIERVECKLSDTEDFAIYTVTEGTNYRNGNVFLSFDDNIETDIKVDKLLDLSGYDLLEGYYRLVMKVIDKSGNNTFKEFYFVYDEKMPELSEIFYTTVNKIKFNTRLINNKLVDIASFTVSKDNETPETYTRKVNTPELIKSFSYSDTGNVHKFTFVAKDYAGNEKTFTIEDCMKLGCIYYSDNMCSMNYYDFKTVEGLVIDLTTYKNPETSVKVCGKIYNDLDSDDIRWGKVNGVYDSDEGWVNSSNAISVENNRKSGTIWNYFITTFNKNHTTLEDEDWYLPSKKEMVTFVNNKNTFIESVNSLPEREFDEGVFNFEWVSTSTTYYDGAYYYQTVNKYLDFNISLGTPITDGWLYPFIIMAQKVTE